MQSERFVGQRDGRDVERASVEQFGNPGVLYLMDADTMNSCSSPVNQQLADVAITPLA